MSARIVRKAPNVAVIGIDHHNGLYYLNLWTLTAPIAPVPPVPIPPGLMPVPQSFHAVIANADWFDLDDRSNGDVIAEHKPVVSKGHVAKMPVHVPPGGNVLIPLVILLGSATWKLGVASVIAGKGPLASTIASDSGLTLDCGDPCSSPTGIFSSPSSVQISPTAGDFFAAAAECAVQMALEVVIAFGVSKLAPRLKGLFLNRFTNVIEKAAEESAERTAREATERAVMREGKDTFLQNVLEQHGKDVADMARKRIEGQAAEQAANQAKKAAAEQAAEQFKASQKAAGEQAAKKAKEAVADEGMDPAKAAEKGTDESVQKWFTDNGDKHKGTWVGPEAGEQAKNAAPGNVKQDATKAIGEQGEEHWLSPGYPVDGGLEKTKQAVVEKGVEKIVGDPESTDEGQPGKNEE